MFMYPEQIPPDHRLRFVSARNLSAEEHTPLGFPRVTQPGIGIYAYPERKPYSEYIIQKVPERILDQWAEKLKAWWTDKPGADAHFMFEMHQKCKDRREWDQRYIFRPAVFPRSYQYEIDCIETRRLQKLRQKISRDEQRNKLKKEGVKHDESGKCLDEMKSDQELDENIQKEEQLRWTEQPKLFAKSQLDPCEKRKEFKRIGKPFKSEACRFYYENYPNISKFRAINKKLS